jgi:nucleotidyltransferase substrate binding protein (TIGR01987 family)
MTPQTADEKPRWMRRYDSYTRALALLREAIQAMRTHTIKDLEKEGLIKRFEFVCELGWKLQKDYLENEGAAIDVSSPSSVVKEAFTFRLIPSAELWMNAIKDRNLSAHIYDRDTAAAILGRIIDLHLPLFDALHRKLLDYLPPNDRPATSHGLAERHIAIIRDIFAPYADRIERVDLFGSRATGRYRPESDIDMVVHGALTHDDVARIRRLLDETVLPYKIDLCAYHLIDYPPFKANIDAVAKTLLTQADLRAPQQDKSLSPRTPP